MLGKDKENKLSPTLSLTKERELKGMALLSSSPLFSLSCRRRGQG